MTLMLCPCETKADIRRFIDLPYRLGQSWPNWVRQPRIQIAKTLDPKKHPFHDHGKMTKALAVRDGRVVGRIAAIDDHGHLQRHQDNSFHFGFFDCENDKEAAGLLFDWVADTAKAAGREILRGPFNPSVHDEIGLQIDSFDRQNFLMVPGNPPYYADLIEASGFDHCVDLHCYGLPMDRMSQRVISLAEKIRQRFGLIVRAPTKRSIRADVARLQGVYNSAWHANWPWRPAEDDEFAHIVESLLEVVDLRYVVLIEDAGGNLIGFSIAIPNLHEVFARMPDGRLFPTGLAKLLWYGRKGQVKSMRVIAMGLHEDWRGRGIDTIFHATQYAVGRKDGVEFVELSQVLDSNQMMRRTASAVGGDIRMTHRLYERKLCYDNEFSMPVR